MSKEAIEGLSKPMVDLYNAFETEMLYNMASLLKGKESLLGEDPEAWKLQQLQLLGMLDKTNLQTMKKYANMTSTELNALIVNAGLQGLELTDAEVEKAMEKKPGAHQIIPPALQDTPAIVSILDAYQRQAADTFNMTNLTMLNSSKQNYIDQINRASLQVASGVKDAHSAMKMVINNWADMGIPALVDRRGAKWGPEGYVRMVTLTSVNNATNELEDARYEQWGVKHVEVSAHMGARPKCAPYQGRVYSLDGKDPEYPSLYDTSIGDPAGLFGINCKHRKYPFFPGISQRTYKPYPKEENDKVYKQMQKQRSIERDIRKAKQRQLMHEAAGNKTEAKAAEMLVKKRQKKMRDFIEETGLTRRRGREQIYRATGKGDLKNLPPVPKAKVPKNPKPKQKPIPEPKPKPIPEKAQVPKKSPLELAVENAKLDPDLDKALMSKYTKAIDKAFKSGKTFDQLEPHHQKFVKKYGFMSEKDHEFLKKYGFMKNNEKLDGLDETDLLAKAKAKSNKTAKAVAGYTPEDLKRFKELRQIGQWDLDEDEKIIRGLSQSDQAIIHKYTTSYYTKMNSYLRSRLPRDPSRQIHKEVEHLKKVIKDNAHPLKEDTKFFRVMYDDALPFLFDKETSTLMQNAIRSSSQREIDMLTAQVKEKVVGGALHDEAFISSAYEYGAFGRREVEIHIHAPKGSRHGMFVGSVGEFGDDEAEYLFNAGIKFDIVDVEFETRKMKMHVVPREE